MVSGHNFAYVKSSAGAGGLGVLRLGAGDMTNKTDLPVATFTIKLDTIANEEIGFFRSADTPFTANQRGIYLRVSASKLYCVTGDGVNEEAFDITPAGFAINKYYQLRIEVHSTSVWFYIDNLVTAVQTNTNYITTDDLTFKMSSKVSGGVSQIMHMDGFGLVRLRKQ